MLRKLQEDLQKVTGWAGGGQGVTGLPRERSQPRDTCRPPPQEKADRAALEEEVRSLRLQAESESAATRLLLASKQLGSPTSERA